MSRDDLRTLEKRLESWEAVKSPAWLAEHAPKAIAEIEEMIAAERARLNRQ